MQEHLYKHFKSERHSGFRHDVSVILIDKADCSNSTKRETYWMRTLKTIAPYGLNVENNVNIFYFDVRDVWREGIYSLAMNLLDLDFGMFLGRGIGRDSYLFSAIYLFSLLYVCHVRLIFVYLCIFFFFFPSHLIRLRTPLRGCN